jgi:hypothetical protein
MTTAPMTALQWTDIAHIKDIDSISSEDHECLEEIRDILARHSRLNKFGIALLHHHFPLHDTEILVESVDPYGRTLSSTPVAWSKIDRAKVMETLWRFGPNVGDVRSMAGCDTTTISHPDWVEPHHPPTSVPSTPPTTPTPPPSVPPTPPTTPPPSPSNPPPPRR